MCRCEMDTVLCYLSYTPYKVPARKFALPTNHIIVLVLLSASTINKIVSLFVIVLMPSRLFQKLEMSIMTE